MSEACLALALIGAIASVAFGLVLLATRVVDELDRRRRAAWRAEQMQRNAPHCLPKLSSGQLRARDQASFSPVVRCFQCGDPVVLNLWGDGKACCRNCGVVTFLTPGQLREGDRTAVRG